MIMVNVTKKEFYDYVNPRDIVISSSEYVTNFKTRSGLLVGTNSGYLDDDKDQYKLTQEAYDSLKGERNEDECISTDGSNSGN